MSISITRRSVALAAMAAAAPLHAAAQDTSFVRQDDEIEAALAARSFIGLTTAVLRNGRPVHVRGYGLASIPFSAPANEQTLFQVGSLGKQFTACAVLRLIEAGRVRLEHPIGTHVQGLPASWRAITVRQLLTHTSGLPEYDGDSFEWDRPATRASLLAAAGGTLRYAPGDAWLYSNTGFVVLGWLLEDATGQSYADHIRTQILEPLGMQEARSDDGEIPITQRAEPYELVDGVIRYATRMSSSVSSMPDGGLLLSARDYARWLQELRAPTLFSAASARLMRTPVVLNNGTRVPYGMGWIVDRVRGREFVRHSGDVPGFYSYAVWSPRDDVASFVSANLEAPIARADVRALAVEFAAESAPMISAYTLSAMRDRDSERTASARALMTRGDTMPDVNVFAPNLRRSISADTHIGFVPSVSSVTDFHLVEEFAFLGLYARRYRLHYGNGAQPSHSLFAYDRSGQIAWIF